MTSLTKNATYRVLEHQKVLTSQGLSCNETTEIFGVQVRQKWPIRLRRIGYRGPETGKHYVFLTNHFGLSAKTIADVYKQRW